MTTEPSSPVPHGRDRAHAAMLLLVLAATHLVFNFVLTPNSPFPNHPDDFSFLAGTLADMGWDWKRPVSTNVIFLVAAGGQLASYVVLNASAVLVAWLALLLVRDVFDVRPGVLAALACGAVLSSHPAALQHGKYLGLMTNLVSHGFGLACLLLLWHGWRRASAWRCALAALAYLASAFAKEDFVLPPLLLVALLWAPGSACLPVGRGATPWPRGSRIALSVLFVAIAVGSMAWQAYDRNPFVAGLFTPDSSSASYAVELAPAALLRAFGMLFFGYTWVATLLAAAAWAALWVAAPTLRVRLAWFAATVVSLAVPYALIPNNMPVYRAYAWLPWMAAIVAVALTLLAQRVPRHAAMPRRAVPALAAIAVALGAALLHHDARLDLAARYAAGESVNRHMLDALEQERAALQDAPLVGLHGLGENSPWCGNGTVYLARKRGFQQRWLVLAPGETSCYRNPAQGGRKPRHDLRVSVAPPAHACSQPTLPVLVFDAHGRGTRMTGRDLCAASGGAVAGP
ncbi:MULTISPECIES: hypothetical protein [unclassified Luteimonas]|uniref:hypothetical protein n=1 Tax=unclassified Luteimonas TaxID=2629088 RepID=UPI001603998A|nr:MULTISPECIES: hypothetical protein [unclassified Luteimonas]MBB1472858.1 hypothetical protein [Luteimonas sp. MC1782]MBB6598438.1 hypothetical protein [Luteimonas sp. MC1825]QOC88635.1 hypothetical protein IDM46_02425 [Luteimonas sp. MC1825]